MKYLISNQMRFSQVLEYYKQLDRTGRDRETCKSVLRSCININSLWDNAIKVSSLPDYRKGDKYHEVSEIVAIKEIKSLIKLIDIFMKIYGEVEERAFIDRLEELYDSLRILLHSFGVKQSLQKIENEMHRLSGTLKAIEFKDMLDILDTLNSKCKLHKDKEEYLFLN